MLPTVYKTHFFCALFKFFFMVPTENLDLTQIGEKKTYLNIHNLASFFLWFKWALFLLNIDLSVKKSQK